MNDRSVNLLEQYEIEVLRTRKGRGAILCDTEQGCLILKEYTGKEEQLALQDRLLRQIHERGQVKAELILPARDGSLTVKDNEGTRYLLKTWCEGRECSSFDRVECVEAMRLLAHLHQCMELPPDSQGTLGSYSPGREYDKHNRELKRVRKFLQQRSQKTWFEIRLLGTFDLFLKQALEVTDGWKNYEKRNAFSRNPDANIRYCHGDYQYHNILREDNSFFLVNFEKCVADSPVRDLYLLLRKLLEKSNWSVALGRELLMTYEEEQPLSAMDRMDLFYRLSYPEKFWKIANFYYNSGKAWIPERNQEKLQKLIDQEAAKKHFLSQLFPDFYGSW